MSATTLTIGDHTYRVGDAVQVRAFGGNRLGIVTKLGRTRVHVEFIRNREGGYGDGDFSALRPVNDVAPAHLASVVAAAKRRAEAWAAGHDDRVAAHRAAQTGTRPTPAPVKTEEKAPVVEAPVEAKPRKITPSDRRRAWIRDVYAETNRLAGEGIQASDAEWEAVLDRIATEGPAMSRKPAWQAAIQWFADYRTEGRFDARWTALQGSLHLANAA